MKRSVCIILIIILVMVLGFTLFKDKPKANVNPATQQINAPIDGSLQQQPRVYAVEIRNNRLNFPELNIQKGSRVAWTNNDGKMHSITSKTALFDSGTLPSGKSYSYVFNNPGIYEYYSVFNHSLIGKINVE